MARAGAREFAPRSWWRRAATLRTGAPSCVCKNASNGSVPTRSRNARRSYGVVPDVVHRSFEAHLVAADDEMFASAQCDDLVRVAGRRLRRGGATVATTRHPK